MELMKQNKYIFFNENYILSNLVAFELIFKYSDMVAGLTTNLQIFLNMFEYYTCTYMYLVTIISST